MGSPSMHWEWTGGVLGPGLRPCQCSSLLMSSLGFNLLRELLHGAVEVLASAHLPPETNTALKV